MPPPSIAVAGADSRWAVVAIDGSFAPTVVAADEILRLEQDLQPRWVWWDQRTAGGLVAANIRPGRCWDLAAVHRLLHGGGRSDAGSVWAGAHGLSPDDLPSSAEPTLFSPVDDHDPARPVRDDGHLAAEWVAGRWRSDDSTLLAWARLAADSVWAGRSDPSPPPL